MFETRTASELTSNKIYYIYTHTAHSGHDCGKVLSACVFFWGLVVVMLVFVFCCPRAKTPLLRWQVSSGGPQDVALGGWTVHRGPLESRWGIHALASASWRFLDETNISKTRCFRLAGHIMPYPPFSYHIQCNRAYTARNLVHPTTNSFCGGSWAILKPAFRQPPRRPEAFHAAISTLGGGRS